jgi:hypothetical protein
MPTTWSDSADAIMTGDLAVALGYATPAGGTVLAAVAPIGLRDRERGTVTFTTSLGFGRKLDRIRQNPRVALAYHAREHGFCSTPGHVLVQGNATFDASPDAELLATVVRPASERFMGPAKRGFFWDRWLREYYADRVLVTVEVERVAFWQDPSCAGMPALDGAALPARPPPPQAPTRNGVAPRVEVASVARPAQRLPHVLLGFLGGDGFPVVVPVSIAGVEPRGIRLSAAHGVLPPGGRRAGLLSHRFNAKLIGLESRQHTGWLDVTAGGGAIYAPHTKSGFRAPANKTILLLGNGLMAKHGLRRARKHQSSPPAAAA